MSLVALDLVISALIAIAIPLAAWAASRGLPTSARRRAVLTALIYVAALMGVSGILAAKGVLRDFSSMPPPLMRLLLGLSLATLALALSPFGRAIAVGLPLWILVGAQAFRILVELLLFGLHRERLIPVQMTFEGYNFDVLTGLSAPVVAWLSRQGRISSRALWLWNLVGLGLLLNIVAIAFLSMPTPLRAFSQEPANRLVAEFPFVWIPCLMVQAALLGHLLIFRSLAAARAPQDG
jgi:hypothetical protein